MPLQSREEIISNWVINWNLNEIPYNGSDKTTWDGNVLINHPHFKYQRMFFLIAKSRLESIDMIYSWINEIVWTIVQEIEDEDN